MVGGDTITVLLIVVVIFGAWRVIQIQLTVEHRIRRGFCNTCRAWERIVEVDGTDRCFSCGEENIVLKEVRR